MRSVWRSSIARLIIRRCLQAIPVMLGVTVLTFAIMNLLPGGSAFSLAGPGATPEQIWQLEAKLHLNEPFIVRYWHWLLGLLEGHMGTSIVNNEPVAQVIRERFPVTLELVAISLTISLVLTIPCALAAANQPNGVLDRMTTMVSALGIALPGFVLALVLILAFSVHLQLLPAIGFVPITHGLGRNIRSLVLPATALGFPLFCSYLRVLRGDLIDQLEGEEHIITARAKGVSPFRLLTSHALRNSLFSLLTIVGLNLGVLMGGTVLIEEIFGVPGMGQALISSIQLQDVVAVEGIVVVLSSAVVLTSLITDLCYSALDPRIRYGRTGS